MKKVLAWGVHAFTASGIIAGFLAILAISHGSFSEALFWLVVSLIIDGIDGTFARLFKVKEVLPNFNGDSIDHVIDFATYAIIPAYFIFECGALPDSTYVRLIAISFILLSSSYYYGKNSYVTDDMYFEGFPVLWNVVAFYMFFIFDLSPWANFVWVIIFAVLHFIPWKYVYPSRTKEFQAITVGVTLIGFVMVGVVLYTYPDVLLIWKILAYATMAYFVGLTFYHTFKKKKT